MEGISTDLMEGFLVGVLLVLLDFDDLELESSLELFLVFGIGLACLKFSAIGKSKCRAQ